MHPYVLLSCAASIDGYIDDASDSRLLLSNDADFDRVDAERAACDAILVGSTTIRHDDPRLLVRSAARRDARVARGLPPTPVKVTVTRTGDLDPAARFFTAGEVEKIVYVTPSAAGAAVRTVGAVATVVEAADLGTVLADLARRGIGKVMVEGGSTMHTQFLTAGLADELQLVVAPFFVGDSRAPRFVGDGRFPWDSAHRARLADLTRVDDVVLLRYALSDRYPHAPGPPSTHHAPQTPATAT